MASGPITSWEIDGETVQTVSDVIFGGVHLYMGLFCSLSDGSYLAILLSLLVLMVVIGGVFMVSYKSCRNRIWQCNFISSFNLMPLISFSRLVTQGRTLPLLCWTRLLRVDILVLSWSFRKIPVGSDGKASAYNVGDAGSNPGLGRSPGEGNGNPLQYSCLENPW